MKKSLGIINLILISFLFTCGCSKDDEGTVVSNNTPPLPPPLPAVNKPPIADAGPDQTIFVPIDSLSIDAHRSRDADGTIVSFSLTQISGPATSTIEKNLSVLTIHRIKNLIAGSYEFELKVTDNNGAIATDNIQVDVIKNLPGGTEYVFDSLEWYYDGSFGDHVLETPVRPDIFPNDFAPPGSPPFPADMYLRYDTATSWLKLPPHNTSTPPYDMWVYISGHGVFVVDVIRLNLHGRKASLRVKFH